MCTFRWNCMLAGDNWKLTGKQLNPTNAQCGKVAGLVLIETIASSTIYGHTHIMWIAIIIIIIIHNWIRLLAEPNMCQKKPSVHTVRSLRVLGWVSKQSLTSHWCVWRNIRQCVWSCHVCKNKKKSYPQKCNNFRNRYYMSIHLTV